MNSKIAVLIFLILAAVGNAYANSGESMHAGDKTADKAADNKVRSEMYIKGFKESFNTLSKEEQKNAVQKINELGRKFEAVVDSSDYYAALRNKRIAEMKSRKVSTPSEQFSLNRELTKEYLYSSFDSAFMLGERNLDLAGRINDKNLIAQAKIDLAGVFIQGGYFREAAQNLDDINLEEVADSVKVNALITRFNMEFENGFFFAWNLQSHDVSDERMKALYPEILKMLPEDAIEIYQLKSIMSFYKHNYTDATGYCNIVLMKKEDSGDWDYIKALGDMGYCKLGEHDYVAAMDYMVQSASQAIRKGALNNPAFRKIAELMYVIGNNELSSKLINISMDNAMRYNSKYRIIESAKGYPMINRELTQKIERSHKTLIVILIILAALLVALGIILCYSISQHKKVKEQAKMISEYNEELKARNSEMESANRRLTEIHGVTAILTSRMMKGSSMRREIMDKMQKEISRKVKVKQYDDIPGLVENFIKEIKQLQLNIDEILLAFFPDFLEQFNKLMKEDCQMESAKGTLPTEVRIFALWRIGVKKNEDIARCMDYSLNTIKSYKTRIISSSIYEKEDFYDHLMQIKVNV